MLAMTYICAICSRTFLYVAVLLAHLRTQAQTYNGAIRAPLPTQMMRPSQGLLSRFR